MIIIISGSVGTGKTTLAKRLAKSLNYKYLDVKKLILDKNIAGEYDKKRNCIIVDIKKLNAALKKIIIDNKNMIIDSHMSHELPRKYVDHCIITKCDIKELGKRLKRRRYKKDKIKENIECEIFDIPCYSFHHL